MNNKFLPIPRSISSIPNRDGYKFIAVIEDNSLHFAEVEKRGSGFHYVKGVDFKEIIGWYKREEVPNKFLFNKDINIYPNSLKQVNNYLHKKYPTIDLVRGNGYYYIHSNDDKTALMIAGLFTTSIPVYSIKQQTIERWITDVDDLLGGGNIFKY